MAIDSFILKIDLVYQNLFIHNSNDEEARGERFQATVETIYASELKKVYPPTGKKSRNYWWFKELKILGAEEFNILGTVEYCSDLYLCTAEFDANYI